MSVKHWISVRFGVVDLAKNHKGRRNDRFKVHAIGFGKLSSHQQGFRLSALFLTDG